ncbi:MAG: hypothetical protein R3C18_01750 [Planctomycetaceae bacterium]
MDKLKPILNQKFWILAVLVLPMAMYGYFSANGAIKEETASREIALEKVKSSVPGGNDISADYSKKLADINDTLEAEIDAEVVKLWENQQPRMIWPALIAPRVPKTFLGDIDPEPRRRYKSSEYVRVLEKLIDSVEPVKAQSEQETIGDQPQKVWLSGWIPEIYLGPPQTAPTSEDMWNAQIDVWLTQLIFDAIRRQNEGKDSITEAVIRRIDKIELVGGDGTPVLGSAAGGAGNMMSAPSYESYESTGEGPSELGFGGPDVSGLSGLGGMGGSEATVDVSFSPAEEFGRASAAAATSSSSSSSAYGGSGFGVSNAPKLRYIAESETAPYLERGFYLSVVMMEKKLPDFIVELANSPWPVKIVRFHVGPNPYAQKELPGASSGYGPADYGPGPTEFSGIADPSFETSGSPEYGAIPGGLEGDGFAMSGFGGATQANKFSANLKAKYQSNLPPFARASMNHPDLVTVHICGIITIYKQPQIEAAEVAGESGAAVDEALPVLPEGAIDAEGNPIEPAAENATPESVIDPAAPVSPADPATPPGADDPAGAPEETTTETENSGTATGS